MAGEHTLYIVATPIGHRDDLSARAVKILDEVSLIYAEDTRHSLPLLRHHGITTRVTALHEHNERARAALIVAQLQEHGSAALITDAGTPLISDPGFHLVRACQEASVRVSPVPGASALTAALSVSGLPTDRFQFVGFPPSKPTARRTFLEALAAVPHTLVLYESPHRILDSLADLQAAFGSTRQMTIARELTKRFETVLHGSVGSLLEQLQANTDQQKGEFVLVVAGSALLSSSDTPAPVELDKVISTLLPHLPVKSVAKCAAELCGVTKKLAYDRALIIQGKHT